ncbi:polysaccharide deacetylase family protein, partial [Shigella sonnei]
RGGKLPRKSVMLTFDDGYLDNWFQVYPLLKEFNLKAHI